MSHIVSALVIVVALDAMAWLIAWQMQPDEVRGYFRRLSRPPLKPADRRRVMEGLGVDAALFAIVLGILWS